jgi:predicted phosphoribosyltransferase
MAEVIKALSDKSLNLLGEFIDKNRLVIMAGAGVSRNSGMPDWDELAVEFLEQCAFVFKLYKESFNEEIIKQTDILIKDIDKPKKHKRHDLLEHISMY